MLRRALLVALIAAVVAPLSAQAPSGLKVRIDGSPSASALDASATLKVSPTEKGFHVTGGPGAVIFDPANTVKPIFRVRATFTVTKADTSTQYGLFFGGNEMEGATPTYIYFTIAHDGTFQIRHRLGDKVDDIDSSLHFAIKKPDATGKSVNTLEVQVAPTAVSYLVNGAVVDATPTRGGTGAFTETAKDAGIVGVRIDNQVDVQVDGFLFQSPFQLNDRGQ
jgi:hypothetical protein